MIAAMAMSGLRRMTTALNLVGQTPPESILREGAPAVFYRVPVERRAALVEAMHWSYGALGGAMFGLLPRRLRRHPLAGPVYGLVFWTGFQFVIAPVFGLPQSRRVHPAEVLALLGDHVLYGVVVASSPWPHED
ncbi:hypothetical protein [Asanoa hainanensis]|uniref:hypothetical protein n=1 Tax=Asanoa hainanensis TaxID=560556 RepID=UPI001C527FD2|nr:hypothetical protein [Asanoa hainanensis]